MRLPGVIQDLNDLLDSLGPADEVAGVLRVNAERLAGRWLVRNVLPLFLTRHPGVSLDLVVDGRFVDIAAEGFDAGVRLGSAVQQDMVAVPFGAISGFSLSHLPPLSTSTGGRTHPTI